MQSLTLKKLLLGTQRISKSPSYADLSAFRSGYWLANPQ